MTARLRHMLIGAIALLLLAPSDALPQSPPPAPPVFAAETLEQLLAPIALYPDDLLANVLMAATYPLEVVEAARWRQEPEHATLADDALAAALAQQDWDPSVKALIPFPQILEMMNARLDWMQKLGDAFLAQQSDVMDAVQRLRRRAAQAGSLVSTPQQSVADQSGVVTIAPAEAGEVYPPYYDPNLAYGPWPYPEEPPIDFPPPEGYVEGPTLFFGPAIAIIPVLWGWDHWAWRRRELRIDRDRFDALDRRAQRRDTSQPGTPGVWRHDPYHRHGVAYRDPATRARFAPSTTGAPQTHDAFRGFAGSGTPSGSMGQPRNPPRPMLTTPTVPTAPSGAKQAPHGSLPTPAMPPVTVFRGPPTERRVPPAFEGISRGNNVRIETERGRQSLQHVAPPVHNVAPIPAPRNLTPQGGGAQTRTFRRR